MYDPYGGEAAGAIWVVLALVVIALIVVLHFD